MDLRNSSHCGVCTTASVMVLVVMTKPSSAPQPAEAVPYRVVRIPSSRVDRCSGPNEIKATTTPRTTTSVACAVSISRKCCFLHLFNLLTKLSSLCVGYPASSRYRFLESCYTYIPCNDLADGKHPSEYRPTPSAYRLRVQCQSPISSLQVLLGF